VTDIRVAIVNFKPHTVALSRSDKQHCPVQLSISTARPKMASWRDLNDPWSLAGSSALGNLRLGLSNVREASRCL
jgi:hypothetical protein